MKAFETIKCSNSFLKTPPNNLQKIIPNLGLFCIQTKL
jgi:hypothetical protein